MLYSVLWAKPDSWVVPGGVFTMASSLPPNDDTGTPELKKWHISCSSVSDPWSALSSDLPKFLITELSRNNARWTAENTFAADTIILLSCHCRVRSRSGTLTSAHTQSSQTHTFIQNAANEFQHWQGVEDALWILYRCGLLPGNCPDAKCAIVTSVSF